MSDGPRPAVEARAKLLSLWLAELSAVNGSARRWGTAQYFLGATSFGLLGGVGVGRLNSSDTRGERGAGVFVSGLMLGRSAHDRSARTPRAVASTDPEGAGAP